MDMHDLIVNMPAAKRAYNQVLKARIGSVSPELIQGDISYLENLEIYIYLWLDEVVSKREEMEYAARLAEEEC